MFVLVLNDMRSAHYESRHDVARAERVEELLALYQRERVANYQDGRWGKAFRRGGPLEWFNPTLPDLSLGDLVPNGLGHGIHELVSLDHVLENARQRYEDMLAAIPEASAFPVVIDVPAVSVPNDSEVR